MITKRNWQGGVRRLRSALQPQAARERRQATLDQYARAAPGAANAIEIFSGEWTSILPPPFESLSGGRALLFADGRMAWAIDVLGGVRGKRVLELGPLEGGHTYMLDRAGAADILALEANTRAYLRCLVVKEVVGIPSARFECGDFIEYLRGEPPRVDVAIASGVLYHQLRPVELLERLSSITDALYLWTHYYRERPPAIGPALRGWTSTPAEHGGFRHTLHRFTYGTDLELRNFCGGTNSEARWLSKSDIIGALNHFGFTRVTIAFEEPDHPHGACLALVAQR